MTSSQPASPGSARPGSRQSTTTDGPADRTTADIGIVCTHKGELKAFLKRLDRQRKYVERRLIVRGGFLGETLRIAIVEAGPHYADHRTATELLIAEHRPAWIVGAGFSSSLSAQVLHGDLCVANEVSDTHGNLLPVKCTIPPSKRIHVGRLIVADQRPVDAAAKSALAATHPGLAVDTCSLAMVQVCQERQVRCLVIRAIIDDAGETVPETAATMLFRPDSRAVGSAVGSLFRSLRNYSELNAWRSRGSLAADNLDRFMTGVIEQIAAKLGRY